MRVPLILACTLLAGCASYQPRPIAPAQLARRFEQRSLAGAALQHWLVQKLGHEIPRWPLPRWNRRMLTLAAYYYSPALDIARARWGTAKAGIEVAGAIPNPTLQLRFEYTVNHQGAGRPYTTGPALDIPIETAHKRGYRVAQAARLSEAARLDIGNQAWQVRAQVRDALLGLYAGQQRVKLLTQRATTRQRIVAMLDKRHAVGEVAEPLVNQAFLALTQAQAELAAAQGRAQDERARLANAIGIPITALDAVQLDLREFASPVARPAPPAPAAARRAAILHRADLLGALAQYAAAEAALQLEIARQYPDVHLGPGYTYDVGANKIDFGLAGITLPLFDRNQGAIARAQAKRTEAAARAAALQDRIINDLDHALARYRTALGVLRLTTVRLAAAQKQMDSEAARFAAGAADRLAMTEAKVNFQASALARLDDAVAVQQAAGMLEDAMQWPLLPDAPTPAITEKEIAR